jgi:chloride channel protein, CIC family
MEPEKSQDESAVGAGPLVPLAFLAVLVGIGSGAVGAVFRLALHQGATLRDFAVEQAKGYEIGGLVLVMGVAALATALAAGLVRRIAPAASGSGIPHVEAVLRRELEPAPARLIPVKFLGGWLAISCGLALGREGPSVQMGASFAHLVGRAFRRSPKDMRSLIAGGAGAGLATAFNAPAAGAIFVLEELVGRFEPRMAVVALGASAGAIMVSQRIVGDAPDFTVGELVAGGLGAQPLFLALGLFAGFLAILYNRSLLAALAIADRVGGRVELRAAAIGAAVGGLAWMAPSLVGGGDEIAQSALSGHLTLALLPAIFLIRFALGVVSYAAATPGGLFAPLLALGALAGLGFGFCCEAVFPGMALQPEAFAFVGMAAFFAGVVRAPLTGIVLVIEMTGSSALLLPLLLGCFGATLVPSALRNAPVYEALRLRAAKRER